MKSGVWSGVGRKCPGGGGGGYSGRSSGDGIYDSKRGEGGPIMLETVRRMNVVTARLFMVG